MKRYTTTFAALLLSCIGFALASSNVTFAAVPKFTFPVIGPTYYSNDYKAPRSNGKQKHHATDIIAKKGQKVVAAASGTIDFVAYPEPYWGNAVIVKGDDNYCYWYLHLNNDKPGTDNGKGGAMRAYAVDMKEGNRVVAGQLIGWVGDSGNAENTVSHLHFSVHKRKMWTCATDREHDNPPINPYDLFKKAKKIKTPVTSPKQPREIIPFGTGKRTVPGVALGDVDGDGSPDKIVTKGSIGYNTMVQVYNSSNNRIAQFYAFNTSQSNGVDATVGDVDGDGKNEIITAAKTRTGAKVAIYSGAPSFSKVREFAIFNGITTVPRLTTGDINGDGSSEIVVGSGPGMRSIIQVYDQAGVKLSEKNPYSSAYLGGIDVAAGDVQGDAKDEIASVPYSYNSNSLVRVYDENFIKLKEFHAYTTKYNHGARIAIGNVDSLTPKSEIVTIKSSGKPQVNRFTSTGTLLQRSYPIEEWWEGYYDIAATSSSNQQAVSSGGNRRSSIWY